MTVIRPDISVENSRIVQDATLQTAVTLSLLSYARARNDDPVPDKSQLRGWWGDTYAPDQDSFGSRGWTLMGQRMPDALAAAPGIVIEALSWMVTDGIATKIECTAVRTSARVISVSPVIIRGRERVTFADPWTIML